MIYIYMGMWGGGLKVWMKGVFFGCGWVKGGVLKEMGGRVRGLEVGARGRGIWDS